MKRYVIRRLLMAIPLLLAISFVCFVFINLIMRAPVYGDYAAQQGLEDKAEIDQAITDILTSTDEAERQELYDFVLTRLHEDAVYIPLTYETNKALYTSELKGVHFGTDQYDVDFASMYFE